MVKIQVISRLLDDDTNQPRFAGTQLLKGSSEWSPHSGYGNDTGGFPDSVPVCLNLIRSSELTVWIPPQYNLVEGVIRRSVGNGQTRPIESPNHHSTEARRNSAKKLIDSFITGGLYFETEIFGDFYMCKRRNWLVIIAIATGTVFNTLRNDVGPMVSVGV